MVLEYGLSTRQSRSHLTSLPRLRQLVVLVKQAVRDVHLVHGNHVFEGGLKSIIHITSYETVVVEHVRVEFFALNSERLDYVLHHFVTAYSVVLTMNKMTAYKIEQLLSILKVDLHACFGSEIYHAARTVALCAGRDLSADMFYFLLVYIRHYKYLTLSDRVHLFEVLSFHMIVEALDEMLDLFTLLPGHHDDVVQFGLGNKLIEVGGLHFPCHVPRES